MRFSLNVKSANNIKQIKYKAVEFNKLLRHKFLIMKHNMLRKAEQLPPIKGSTSE